ncbi:MAG: PAS domain S-box protein [Alphaproteobacteria bacterium]|nr:PAS domain S-box protein [Alphaproteobacteria bacterium]MDE2011656.1 PAS domain S-box protein [Alphaproteobacteria bacterium]MDE2074685.1 PAS domain S-box protein [Alphaproteobacteria bacterium]MDE2352323.1 PAS domain S-box protein [Alphaproteobacteria bacterium]
MDQAGGNLTSADSDVLFRTVVSTAVDGIIVIDAKGRVLLYNEACARLFGYEADEVIGQNIRMLMPEPYREQHDGYLDRYVATGEARIIGIGREVVGLREDGSTFPMYLSVGEGWLDGERIFLGILHDLTERKMHERRLQELQNDLLHAMRLSVTGQLASALAHELNQPLTASLNYLSAARRGLQASAEPSAARINELLEKAAAQNARAGQIIRRLREFIEKKEPNRAFEDLNASVYEAIALGLVGVDEGDVEVVVKLARDLTPVFFDKIQIQQVMVNLMRNAVEAMQNSARHQLTVMSFQPVPEMVEVVVSDTGPGVNEDIRRSLFHPFTTTKEKGLGMGLAICRGIIESHGGRLWTEPNPGGGAQFRFRLPVRGGQED